MGDVDLRALERRAQTNPGDAAAGLALARALAKSGDRRRSYLELSRVERLGDEAAREALARYTPWGPGPVAAMTGTPVVRAQEVELPRLSRVLEDYNDTQDANPWIRPMSVFVSERCAVVATHELFACTLDRPPVVAWTVPTRGPCARCGPDLLVSSGDGLELLDGRDGRLLAAAGGIPGINGLRVHGDRALVVTSQGESATALAVEVGADFGRVVWRRELLRTRTREVCAAGAGVGVIAQTEAGEHAWTRLHALSLQHDRWVQGPPLTVHDSLGPTDADGLIVQRVTPRGPPGSRGPSELVELRLPGLEPRWSLPLAVREKHPCVVLDRTLAVARVQRTEGRHELVAVERATGDLRWSVPAPERMFGMALADGALYLATVTYQLDLDVIDVTTGAFSAGFEAELRGTSRYFSYDGEGAPHVAAFPGGCVVVRNTPDRAIVVVVASP